MNKMYKKILSLTMIIILLVQLIPISVVQAADNVYIIEENDLPYSNKFVDLFSDQSSSSYGAEQVYVALDKDGDIWTWMTNNNGMFGDGSDDRSYRKLPKKLEVNTKFKQISPTANYWLALDINGNIWGCGYQYYSQLGNGYENRHTSTEDSTERVLFQITSGTEFTKVKASVNSVLALDKNGNIWGWGLNEYGILMNEGKGTYTYSPSESYTYEIITRPLKLTSGTRYIDIDICPNNAGAAAAIDENNNLYMWGHNYSCELARSKSDMSSSNTPIQVKSGTKFSKVSIGDRCVAALDLEGNLYRWGSISALGISESSANRLEGYDSNAKALYEPIIKSDVKFVDIQGGLNVSYAKAADNQYESVNKKYYVWGNNRGGGFGAIADNYGDPISTDFVGVQWIEGLSQYRVIREGLGLDENGYMWRWGFDYINSEGNKVRALEPIQITGENQYTVTFKDGDTVLATQKVTSGGAAQEPTAPTKVGYIFAGWDKDFSNVTSDLTIIAKWTPSSNTLYTVEQYQQNLTLDGYDYIGSDTYEGTTGETVTAGVTGIEGFSVDENNTNNRLSGVVAADGSLVLKVYYDRGVYKVTLNTNGGTIAEGENVTRYTYGVGATLPTPTKQGYTFAGWYITEDLTGEAINTIGTQAAGDKTYHAKWEAGKETIYKVEYYKQNTTLDDYELVDTEERRGITGETIGVVGDTYTGFTYNATKSIPTGEIKADGSLVLKLYYDRNTYNVTLNVDGGTIAEGENVTSYVYGVGAQLPTPTKTGYTFAGWYDQSPLTPQAPVTQIGANEAGSKIYDAKWEEGEGTVYKVEHYKQNPGTNTYDKVDTDDFSGKTGLTVTARPKTYEGYTENQAHEDRVATGEIKADGSLVLKLYYDINEYTVTFVSDGQIINTQTVKHGQGAGAPEQPTKEGYTFVDWDKDFSNVTSNLEVNANWTVNTYNVTLNPNGGTIAEGENVTRYTYGVGATLPTPTRDGYTFAGWYKTEDLTGDAITTIGTLATGDKIYYAKWNNNQYTVIFKDGDTVLSTQTVVYGQAAVAPEAPTKEGYTFAGWDKDFSKVTSNLTVNAKWNKNQEEAPKQIGYKVEHYKQNIKTNTYEKVATEELTGTRGSTVTAVAKTYEGFHENTSHKERVASGEVAEDGSLVLKLYYDINQYKVIFKDGDKVVKEETVTHGGNATPPTITKPGYILSWDKGTDNITGDTTFTAVWTKDPNYVDPNDGKEEKPSFLPQTGESYMVIGTMSVLMSVAVLLYLKYRKLNNM